MIGRTDICKISLILFLAVFSTNAVAQWAVTDPTSYTYYVEQIKKVGEQIDLMRHQAETLGGAKTHLSNIQGQLQGTYNRAKGAVEQVKRLQEIYEESPSTMKGQLQKWGRIGKGVGAFGKTINSFEIDGFENANKVLDWSFGDPRTKGFNPYETMDGRYQAQQQAVKNAIINSELVLAKMPTRLKVVQDLAGQIDETANLKDAADLQNRISVEVLKVLIELLYFAAHYGEAQSMIHYSGVTDDTMMQRMKDIEEAGKKISGLSVFKDFVKSKGLKIGKDATFADLASTLK